jgi:type I restriction enzyme M protein
MTKRIYFKKSENENEYFSEQFAEFVWAKGMALSQRKKSVINMHDAMRLTDQNSRILEVSRASDNVLGSQLSAWNLRLNNVPIEVLFQKSKIYQGERRLDYHEGEKNIKKQIKDQGLDKLEVIGFEFNGHNFAGKPHSYFYDWLYIQGLRNFFISNRAAWEEFDKFDVFTDIFFNQKVPYSRDKGPFNCQARSCCIFKKLTSLGKEEVTKYINKPDEFKQVIYSKFYSDLDARKLSDKRKP